MGAKDTKTLNDSDIATHHRRAGPQGHAGAGADADAHVATDKDAAAQTDADAAPATVIKSDRDA